MSRVVLRAVRLRGFGRFEELVARFERGLNVLAQPNEWGKSTLVAAVEATLFGFRSVSAERGGRTWLAGRERYRSWYGFGPFDASLVFERDGELFQLYREFESARVVLRSRPAEGGVPDDALQPPPSGRGGGSGGWVQRFRGVHRPRGARTADAFENLLRDLLGLSSAELFEQTFCLTQRLPEADQLDGAVQELITGAGTAGLEAARQWLVERARALTTRTDRLGLTPEAGRRPRQEEELEARIAQLAARLESSRQRLDQQAPLKEELARAEEEAARLRRLVEEQARTVEAMEQWLQHWHARESRLRELAAIEQAASHGQQLVERLQRAIRQLAQEFAGLQNLGDDAAERLEKLAAAREQAERLTRRLAEQEAALEERRVQLALQRQRLEEEFADLHARTDLAELPGRHRLLVEKAARLRELRRQLAELEHRGEHLRQELAPLTAWSGRGPRPSAEVRDRRQQAEQLAERWRAVRELYARREALKQASAAFAVFEQASPQQLDALRAYAARREDLGGRVAELRGRLLEAEATLRQLDEDERRLQQLNEDLVSLEARLARQGEPDLAGYLEQLLELARRRKRLAGLQKRLGEGAARLAVRVHRGLAGEVAAGLVAAAVAAAAVATWLGRSGSALAGAAGPMIPAAAGAWANWLAGGLGALAALGLLWALRWRLRLRHLTALRRLARMLDVWAADRASAGKEGGGGGRSGASAPDGEAAPQTALVGLRLPAVWQADDGTGPGPEGLAGLVERARSYQRQREQLAARRRQLFQQGITPQALQAHRVRLVQLEEELGQLDRQVEPFMQAYGAEASRALEKWEHLKGELRQVDDRLALYLAEWAPGPWPGAPVPELAEVAGWPPPARVAGLCEWLLAAATACGRSVRVEQVTTLGGLADMAAELDGGFWEQAEASAQAFEALNAELEGVLNRLDALRGGPGDGGGELARLEAELLELRRASAPFDEETDPAALARRVQDCLELRQQVRAREAELGEREQEVRALKAELQESLARVAALEAELAPLLEPCRGDLELARQRLRAFGELRRQVDADREQLRGLLQGFGVGELSDLQARRLAVERSLADCEQRLRALEERYPALPRYEQAPDVAALQEQYRRLQEVLDQTRQEAAAAQEQQNQLMRRQLALEAGETINVASAELEMQRLRRQLEAVREEAAAVAEAYRQLEAAAAEYHREFRRQLEAIASDFFSRFTRRPGRRVVVDEQFRLQVVDPDGQVYSPQLLSQGARDQLYLALRLTVAAMVDRQLRLPFILDDPFLNCDDARLQEIRLALEEVASTSQVILLTHRTELTGWGRPVEVHAL